MNKNIAIGCDPNAYDAKKGLIEFLKNKGYAIKDFGSDNPIYANVSIDLAESVAKGEFDKGILICGTGIGVSISANKVKGAYAALISDAYSAERAALSNNANIICFGAQTLGQKLIEEYSAIFLKNEFDENGPSAAKVAKFVEYDKR